MIGLALRLVWGRIWRHLSNAASWAAKCPLCAVCLALAVLAGVQTWRLSGVKQSLTTARAQIARIEAAQKDAAEAQAAVNRAPAILSQAIARKSDAEALVYYAAVRRAADAHRVQPQARAPRPADLPGTDHPAPIDDRPATASDLVCRPRADDDLLVNATGRAARMHQDALDLIAAGVAVASP